ncbi:nuclease-related domain-containing protein [Microbacterium sp. NE2HP2]|uniref:nuclease-related domain-containing protein n=1 Tax=Microbacterium TaxID=33882 RepID=UPI002365352B|nr:nuclease-related domain-containing protein [Microbacterium plantarum]MDD7944647.1 nuclease-related domain-containing protein [Microbacterium plantarum]
MVEVLASIAALLALVLVVVVLVWRYRARSTRVRTAAERAASEQHLAEVTASHAAAVNQLRNEHEAAVQAVIDERDRAVGESRRAREQMARVLGTDAVSKRLIAAACADVGLSGVLVTNVVFVPDDTRNTFFAQIDHVLLTRQAAILIENKYWQGLIFDDVRPSSVIPAFRAMLDEEKLEAPFALQIRPISESAWEVLRHVGADSPAVQVRRQARRLAEHLRARWGEAPFFTTAVLYSHGDASVHAKPVSRSSSGVTTRVLSGSKGLVRMLAEVRQQPPTALTVAQLEQLRAYFESLGAHVERVGD